MNTMIKMTSEYGNSFTSCPVSTYEATINCYEALAAKCDFDLFISVFSAGEMPLNELPAEVQTQVKDILKAYRRVYVTYEHGEFHVSTGCCVKSHYSHDHFACGEYKDVDVYTEEERRQNYIEVFG